jgi:hypothetical protein
MIVPQTPLTCNRNSDILASSKFTAPRRTRKNMRTLTDHIVEGDSANHQVRIDVLDEPGAGGANHRYNIEWYDGVKRDDKGSAIGGRAECFINFQNGPIKECGVNGVTQEALLAIVIDRLRSFQQGPFAGDYNARALECFEQGLEWLQKRTKDRISRNVEGTHQK